MIEADRMALDFAMAMGRESDSITILESPLLFDASDASVRTFVGSRFVENMPLNGNLAFRKQWKINEADYQIGIGQIHLTPLRTLGVDNNEAVRVSHREGAQEHRIN